MAWHHISPEVTVKDFQKCSILNAVGRTGVMLWHDHDEDGNVSSEHEEDKGTD
jgi:hypothetical protein